MSKSACGPNNHQRVVSVISESEFVGLNRSQIPNESQPSQPNIETPGQRRSKAAREFDAVIAKRVATLRGQADRNAVRPLGVPSRETPHNLAAQSWCDRFTGMRTGFMRGVRQSIYFWHRTRQLSGDGLEVLQHLRDGFTPGFIPDAWRVEDASPSHWATHRIIALEVMHSSPITEAKLNLFGSFWWFIEMAGVEFCVDVLDRTSTLRRLDMQGHAYDTLGKECTLPLRFLPLEVRQ